MDNPWAFGWTQILTIIGFIITIAIATTGFRSFKRWRREQIESKRIDIAIEALTIAYKTKFVFEQIRSLMAYGYEWTDMPSLPGDTEDKRSRRGTFYAVFKRIEHNKDFFNAVWELQPKFMAVFGPETEKIFLKVHKARRNIEVAAQMLYQQAVSPEEREERDESTRKLYGQLRGHLWPGMSKEVGAEDEVSVLIEEFKVEIEKICKPVLVEFRRIAPNTEKPLIVGPGGV